MYNRKVRNSEEKTISSVCRCTDANKILFAKRLQFVRSSFTVVEQLKIIRKFTTAVIMTSYNYYTFGMLEFKAIKTLAGSY